MGFGIRGLGYGVWGMGFGVWGLGFGVWGLGFGVLGVRFWVLGFGCGVWGLVFGVWGLGFGVWGLGSERMNASLPGSLREKNGIVELVAKNETCNPEGNLKANHTFLKSTPTGILTCWSVFVWELT